MSITTDIEKKSLEAHVELCAERYSALETKLENLDKRMDNLEGHIIDIKDKITGVGSDSSKTIITIGTTILGVMIAGIITLIATHFK
jgi:predicted  nucleic acid-binding Zn-ribbon protein